MVSISSKDKLIDPLVKLNKILENSRSICAGVEISEELISDLYDRRYLNRYNGHHSEYILSDLAISTLQRYYSLEASRSIKKSVQTLGEVITKLDSTSTKINEKILQHTKTMKNLTIAILIITLLNFALILVI